METSEHTKDGSTGGGAGTGRPADARASGTVASGSVASGTVAGGLAVAIGIALVVAALVATLDANTVVSASGSSGAPTRILGALARPLHEAVHGPSPSGPAPADLARTAQWLVGAALVLGLALAGAGVALWRRAER
ncbi:hypothetical protein Pla163_09190 [Planctomycetes bacterium Pla163]|uniref:Uncharacterized protein n=1 Tax=Rohdeia mirabilis TaxID=2528008 RepID=A0A518CX87_9BACT|nr:hypothetical protein Pla163_09190 [Planctomycetes bacterium Pla163]